MKNLRNSANDKKYLLLTALSFITWFGYAQNQYPLRVNYNTVEESDQREVLQFGVKIGANYSNVYDTRGEEFDANGKFGLATGIFIAVPIGRFLGIQPELLISQKGFKAKGRILNLPYEFTRTTTYLDIPLLVSIKPSSSFSILVGPQYSYLIKEKNVYANTITTIEQEKEFENDNIRKNILSFLGGIDINLDHLVLGGRVGWDVLNNNGDGTSTTPRYKNVWYQLTLGFRFYR